MKKHWTLLKFVSLLTVLAVFLLLDTQLMAQTIQKTTDPNWKKEVLAKIEKEVANRVNAELQKLYSTENSHSVALKSSVIRDIPVKSAVSETDSTLLVNFYNSTDGPNWTNNANWLTGPVNTWYGITVEAEVVTEIKLNDNNLSGTIPADIGQLASLKHLELDTNKLTGAIPIELGQLAQLEYLYLDGNQLTGNIPLELLQLTNLSLLYLSDNQLTGTIPDGFEQLTKLRWIDLSDNQLTGPIPEVFGQFTQLVFLDLGQNQLTGPIPSELGQLTPLRWLILSQNQLSGKIPVELANLINLEQLYLDGNELSDIIPAELGQLLNLLWLNLGQNQLTGLIPDEFKELTNLKLLYLNENQLSGSVLSGLGQLSDLEWLNLSKNLLTGELPVEFWQLTKLRLIYLNSNQLSGIIPAQVGQISDVEWMDLSQNLITGAVPEEINQLVNLLVLDLHSNHFDALPEITALENLTILDVSSNNFSFEHLEYNMDVAQYANFYYAPQDSVGLTHTIVKKLGTSFSYDAPTGGEQNNYQWYKDDAILSSQTSSSLIINSLANEDFGKYFCIVTNDVVTGLTLTSRVLTLKIDESDVLCQKMQLTEGWQIISAPVIPDSSDMKFLFQSLIDSSTLMKIQDEAGNAIEDYGFLGWQNFIGDINPGKGYKLRVSGKDSIEICGTLVDYPYSISLKAGWNIMGFPQTTDVDAQKVVQSLIDKNNLEKVQDEMGNAIEDWGYPLGWKNFIQNFTPGKGYKIKLSADDTIQIMEGYLKSVAILPEQVPTKHFKTTFLGNGVDHMNINITNLPKTFFRSGDELAVYDGDLCVGAVALMPHHFSDQAVPIAVSAADEFGMPGFKEGNIFTLKLWSSLQNNEYELNPEILKGTSTFAKHETSKLSLEKYASTGLDDNLSSNETEINCFPNPFKDEVTIEFNLGMETEVKATIYNHLGQRITTLLPNKKLNNGLHRLTWDGTESGRKKTVSGLYYVRIELDGIVHVRKIVLND